MLAALATTNLAAGLWMALTPRQASEVGRVADWAGLWIHGIDPYATTSLAVDYPPWALVVLSPLQGIPAHVQGAVWAVFNLGLVALLTWRLTRVSAESPAHRTNLLLLLASMACLRSLGQFSLLSLALGILGAFAGSPVVGGVLIGLALMKPQIGGCVLLWLLFERDWKRAAIAVAVPIVLTVVFMAVVRVDPMTLISEYRAVIGALYASPLDLAGHSELRPWLWRLGAGETLNVWLTAITGIVLLAPAVTAAFRRRVTTVDATLELLALCGVTSLLTVRHLSYDFILLLPAVVAWRVPPFAARDHAPRWLMLGLATLLIVAIPSWTRLLLGLGAPAWLGAFTQTDRVMCLAAWAVLSWRLNARAPRAETP